MDGYIKSVDNDGTIELAFTKEGREKLVVSGQAEDVSIGLSKVHLNNDAVGFLKNQVEYEYEYEYLEFRTGIPMQTVGRVPIRRRPTNLEDLNYMRGKFLLPLLTEEDLEPIKWDVAEPVIGLQNRHHIEPTQPRTRRLSS